MSAIAPALAVSRLHSLGRHHRRPYVGLYYKPEGFLQVGYMALAFLPLHHPSCRRRYHGSAYRKCSTECKKEAENGNIVFVLGHSDAVYPEQVRHLPGPRASDAGCGPPSDLPEHVTQSILRPP